MSFHQPAFLYGLVAIAIPILLHLLNLQRYRKQSFTNVAMLQMFEKTSRRKVQMKEWLVLLARCFFIVFLVLAFAQPYFRSPSMILASVTHANTYLLIDNSLSMSRQDGQNNSLLERGKTLYTTLIQNAHEQSYFSILTSNAQSLYSTASLSKPSALKKVSEIRLHSNTSRSSKFENSSQLLWLVSDFQKSNTWWEEVLDDTSLKANLVLMQDEPTGNVYVDSVWVSDYPNPESKKVEFTADIRWTGKEELKDVTIRVLHNETLNKTLTTKLKPFSPNILTFQATYLPETSNAYTISFNDNPIAFDNQFYFSLPGLKQIQVCLISDNSEVFQKVFSNQDFFKVTDMKPSNADYSALEQAHVIVISGIVVNFDILLERLLQRSDQGATIILHPGVRGDTALFQKLLETFNIKSQKITGVQGNEEVMQELLIPASANRFFADILEKNNEKIVLPKAIPLVQIQGQQQLLRTRTGLPVVAIDSRNNNTIAVFNTLLNEEQGTLVLHSLFLPILYKIAFSSIPLAELPVYVRHSEEFYLPQSIIPGPKTTLLEVKVDTFKSIPLQYVQGGLIVMQLDAGLLKPGIFKVYVGNEIVSEIAYNAPKVESQPQVFTIEELNERYASQPRLRIMTADMALAELDTQRQKGVKGLTWIAVIVALSFLAFEVLLLRLFKL